MARKILLADDSVTAQNMGRKILADAGYEVITVNNGSAALKKIAEQKPDLIVLDVYMPGYSGLEVCQRLKEASETARIPVMLTVGKLEPFKPEEAKRVRAEGFIVKPFEASELLSALAKLEDKIVPRSEPSKPGRFARAFAAAEEADRPESGTEDNGWKKRIAFPAKKSKAAEQEDNPEEYTPVNRDLRTAVNKDKKKSKAEDVRASDSRVDVGALAPSGLPKDVTPEEIAAITAAAAQMQGRSNEAAEAPPANIEAPSGAEAVVAKADEKLQARPEIQVDDKAETSGLSQPPATAEEAESREEAVGATFVGRDTDERTDSVAQRPEKTAEEDEQKRPLRPAGSDAEVMAAIAALQPANGQSWDASGSADETENAKGNASNSSDAVAASAVNDPAISGPRWTAVPVAMAADETAISLEHEMHKAHAAFAAAEGANTAYVVPAVVDSPSTDGDAENKSESTQAADEKLEPAAAFEAAVPAAEAVSASASETDIASAPALSEMAVTPNPEMPEPVESNFANQPSPYAAAEEWKDGAPHAAAETAEATTSAPTTSESRPTESSASEPAAVPDMASAVAEVTAGWNSDNGSAPEIDQKQDSPVGDQPEAGPRHDSDMAATTAAAWATWRQIRDTDPTANQFDRAKEFAAHESSATQVEAVAMAAAAGAEQGADSSSAELPDEAKNIASIVESVMAELRPKIVAEISKKLAAEKK